MPLTERQLATAEQGFSAKARTTYYRRSRIAARRNDKAIDDFKARPECRSLLHRKQEHIRRDISSRRIKYGHGLQ